MPDILEQITAKPVTLFEGARHVNGSVSQLPAWASGQGAGQDLIMRDESDVRAETRLLLSRVAHVVERIGLAMSGAMCGTFVAACLARASIEMFDSIGFIMSMILIGIIGFYLGIDIPRQRARHVSCGVKRSRLRVDPVELLSATGTFLAAVAALTSVYALVFDEVLQRIWEFVIGFWWLLGAIMQIGAGAIGRMRLANKAAG